MTYIDYLNLFNQWLETNALPVSSQLMYFKLLNIFNRAGWPEDVGVDNLRLQFMIDAKSEKTAIRARDRLVEAGFLIYKKGKKGSPNRYSLKKYTVNNYSTNDSLCDSTNDSHIKTKTKTKTKNNTLNSSLSVTIESAPPPKKRFTPPTVEEVRAYCLDRNNGIDPEQFVNFYESKGWCVGKNPMKDWKSAVRTWEGRRRQENTSNGAYQSQKATQYSHGSDRLAEMLKRGDFDD